MRNDAIRLPVQPYGLEALDRMGIDIDQDPRAFAQFLELRKLMLARRRPTMPATPRPPRVARRPD